MTYRDAVLEIYRWQYTSSFSYYNMLILCMLKADDDNRRRLAIAYPLLSQAFDDWNAADHQDDLFKHYLSIQDVAQMHKHWFL